MHGAEEDAPTRFAFNHIPDLSTQELAELDEELLSQGRHFAIRVDRLFGWGLTTPPKLPTEGLLPAFPQERWGVPLITLPQRDCDMSSSAQNC